ncbi:hypothetical protein AcW1_004548 [Taiwanofungus camphoratus]|nr:hypothetical protein AcW1_004548 [Antrodia cinnamomea]
MLLSLHITFEVRTCSLDHHHVCGQPSEPETLYPGIDRQAGVREAKVGPRVQGFPRQYGRLHEPPACEHGGVSRRQIEWRSRRGLHSL